MPRLRLAAFAVALCSAACGGDDSHAQTPAATTAEAPPAAQGSARTATFTEADLDRFERGFIREVEAVKAAQKRAAAATTAQERGAAMQAQFEMATIPAGAEASGLPEARYREIRDSVDRVFTTLDFQDKIDGPMSIDLTRADAETKRRVSGDAFADLPASSASALRARMDRLVPIWIDYKKLVAVAG
jgi:hypothetical protein